MRQLSLFTLTDNLLAYGKMPPLPIYPVNLDARREAYNQEDRIGYPVYPVNLL